MGSDIRIGNNTKKEDAKEGEDEQDIFSVADFIRDMSDDGSCYNRSNIDH